MSNLTEEQIMELITDACKEVKSSCDHRTDRTENRLEGRVARLEGAIDSLCPILKMVGDQLMVIADFMEGK